MKTTSRTCTLLQTALLVQLGQRAQVAQLCPLEPLVLPKTPWGQLTSLQTLLTFSTRPMAAFREMPGFSAAANFSHHLPPAHAWNVPMNSLSATTASARAV